MPWCPCAKSDRWHIASKHIQNAEPKPWGWRLNLPASREKKSTFSKKEKRSQVLGQSAITITRLSWSWSVKERCPRVRPIRGARHLRQDTKRIGQSAELQRIMPINFCGKFIILAKTLTMADSRRQALIQRRKRAMQNASGAATGFSPQAGSFREQSGRSSARIPMRKPLRRGQGFASGQTASRAASKLLPFI